MNAPHACPRCGRTLPDDAPHGLCPSCLFGAALAGPGETVDREPVSADQNNTSAGCTALDSGQPENHVGETIACDSGKSVEGDDPTATASIRYFGDYILLRRLGRGGMGEVWLAHQTSLDNRPVAVKTLRAADLDAKDRVRFRNEAEAIAALDHPNLIEIYEVGEHEGEPFYSMKLYSGGSLNDHLSEFHDDPKRTARVMSAVARAVHHVHQRAILHRDLKPANVLLDERGEPHVADFGLAKRLDIDRSLSTIPGAILGTPPYMSPEQAIGRKGAVTTSSDVYGLGAILYSLLTGDAPFAGDSVPEVLQAVCEQAPEPPSRHNPKLPRDLEVICLKCLEKSPQHRYPSAAALAEDLERFLKGEPIIGRPVGSATRFWMWCRRNPWLAGAVGSTAAALVAVALLALLYAERQSKLVKVESEKLREQTEATRKIGGLATDLKTSLGESNRRLASLHLQRRDRVRGQTVRGELVVGGRELARRRAGWRHDLETCRQGYAWLQHGAMDTAEGSFFASRSDCENGDKPGRSFRAHLGLRQDGTSLGRRVKQSSRSTHPDRRAWHRSCDSYRLQGCSYRLRHRLCDALRHGHWKTRRSALPPSWDHLRGTQPGRQDRLHGRPNWCRNPVGQLYSAASWIPPEDASEQFPEWSAVHS